MRMRHWISVLSGNPNDPARLGRRPEVVSKGYGWLLEQAAESMKLGLDVLLHCPLGCPMGSLVPTSIGPSAPLFKELTDGLDWIRSLPWAPSLFIGMRLHDPCSLFAPYDARWIDPKRTATDRAALEDNLRPWSRMGVKHIVFDNSSPNLTAWRNVRDHLSRYFNMTCEVEGMTFVAGSASEPDVSQPSVHTDVVMDRSHPDARAPEGNRAARVCVQWRPDRTADDVVRAMEKWASRGFVLDYQGPLDENVLKAWQSMSPAQ